jgi:hypothetical protein
MAISTHPVRHQLSVVVMTVLAFLVLVTAALVDARPAHATPSVPPGPASGYATRSVPHPSPAP